jgi:hypothetical protein
MLGLNSANHFAAVCLSAAYPGTKANALLAAPRTRGFIGPIEAQMAQRARQVSSVTMNSRLFAQDEGQARWEPTELSSGDARTWRRTFVGAESKQDELAPHEVDAGPFR